MTLTAIPRPVLIVLLALALCAGGCGSSTTKPAGFTTTDLTQSEANDIALQACFALDYVGMDVDGAGGMLSSSVVASRPLVHTVKPLRAAWDTTIVFGGLQAEVSANLYDAEGNALAEFGPTATRLNWRSHIWGTVASLRDTAGVQHHSDYDFTGLQETDSLVVVNGACTDTLLNTFHSLDSLLTRHAYWRSSLAVANAAVRKANGQPVSGTITFTVRADVLNSTTETDVIKHLSATVVVTFNGTAQPDMVVNGTYHYKWVMDGGTVVPL
jgi:hypothetical protein